MAAVELVAFFDDEAEGEPHERHERHEHRAETQLWVTLSQLTTAVSCGTASTCQLFGTRPFGSLRTTCVPRNAASEETGPALSVFFASKRYHWSGVPLLASSMVAESESKV